MVHTDVFPSEGVVQSNPIGQHVLLTAVLCPHAAPGWTVLRQPGRLYWIPEEIPASKMVKSHRRAARYLLRIDVPSAGPVHKQEGRNESVCPKAVRLAYRMIYQSNSYEKHQQDCVPSCHSVLQGFGFRSHPR